jgi:hypothetical protein
LELHRYQLVSAPATGFWRVTDWPDPFSPKDPPPRVGEIEPERDDAGRFDDPDGKFRTVYCAAKPEGALGEKLAAFARRGFTRRLAGILRAAATDSSGELHADGIRYNSRLAPRWVCLALWEPLALQRDQAVIDPVTIDTPALRKAADMLGVIVQH